MMNHNYSTGKIIKCNWNMNLWKKYMESNLMINLNNLNLTIQIVLIKLNLFKYLKINKIMI